MRPQVRFIKDVLKNAGCPSSMVRWKESRSLGAIWFEVIVIEDWDWGTANLVEGNPAVDQLRAVGLSVKVAWEYKGKMMKGWVGVDSIDDLKIPESYGNLSTHLEIS